jgi:hypothetical protein
MLYFLTGARNPTSHEIFRLGLTSAEPVQRAVIDEIERSEVELVVTRTTEITDGRPERRFASHSPILHGYITDHYELRFQDHGEKGSTRLMRRAGGIGVPAAGSPTAGRPCR